MKFEWLFLTIAPCDAAEPWQLGFQDAATPMMQGIIDLHHDIFFFLILILVFVSRILYHPDVHTYHHLLCYTCNGRGSSRSSHYYQLLDINGIGLMSIQTITLYDSEDDLELGQSRLLEVDNRVLYQPKLIYGDIVTPADVPQLGCTFLRVSKCDVLYLVV
ncbi:cytochrome c oxidase subunit 2 [Glycine max]|nr:cytochrome c oxidase subunit 2 [Glycine max]